MSLFPILGRGNGPPHAVVGRCGALDLKNHAAAVVVDRCGFLNILNGALWITRNTKTGGQEGLPFFNRAGVTESANFQNKNVTKPDPKQPKYKFWQGFFFGGNRNYLCGSSKKFRCDIQKSYGAYLKSLPRAQKMRKRLRHKCATVWESPTGGAGRPPFPD